MTSIEETKNVSDKLVFTKEEKALIKECRVLITFWYHILDKEGKPIEKIINSMVIGFRQEGDYLTSDHISRFLLKIRKGKKIDDRSSLYVLSIKGCCSHKHKIDQRELDNPAEECIVYYQIFNVMDNTTDLQHCIMRVKASGKRWTEKDINARRQVIKDIGGTYIDCCRLRYVLMNW